ncbi:CDP-alcohol phosphatidyltransferase family protein [Candidatus Babeliales bacterium]|nr:CDP-alcohol phosphatidyltransferase family protein [Candidatus Babeliales bacterium]
MRTINLRRFKLSVLTRLPVRETKITLPTMFTLLRFVLTPFIVASMVLQHWGLAFWLFVIAAVSDVLDGFLARIMNKRTFLGAALDPLADKFLIVSCFLTLTFVQSPLFGIPVWFVMFVLCKEVLHIAGAITIYLVVGELDIKPTKLGKATTLVQITFISWLFFCYFFHWLPIKTYNFMLGLLLTMVGSAFLDYTRTGIRFLKQHVVRN